MLLEEIEEFFKMNRWEVIFMPVDGEPGSSDIMPDLYPGLEDLLSEQDEELPEEDD